MHEELDHFGDENFEHIAKLHVVTIDEASGVLANFRQGSEAANNLVLWPRRINHIQESLPVCVVAVTVAVAVAAAAVVKSSRVE